MASNPFIDTYFLKPSRQTRLTEQALEAAEQSELRRKREEHLRRSQFMQYKSVYKPEDSLLEESMLRQIPLKQKHGH